MNRGSQYLRGKEGMLKVLQEERGKQPKEIRQYLDEKTGVIVHVYAGPELKPFKTVPTGYDY